MESSQEIMIDSRQFLIETSKDINSSLQRIRKKWEVSHQNEKSPKWKLEELK